MPQTKDVVSSLVFEHTKALFNAYDTPVYRVAEAPGVDSGDEEVCAGILGFTSQQMTGALTLIIPASVVEASHPTGANGDIGQIRDWVGELCNQLVGRMKHNLLQYGVEVQIATPVVLSASRVHLARPGNFGPWYFRTIHNHRFCIWMEAVEHDPITWEIVEIEEDEESMGEGELMLF